MEKDLYQPRKHRLLLSKLFWMHTGNSNHMSSRTSLQTFDSTACFDTLTLWHLLLMKPSLCRGLCFNKSTAMLVALLSCRGEPGSIKHGTKVTEHFLQAHASLICQTMSAPTVRNTSENKLDMSHFYTVIWKKSRKVFTQAVIFFWMSRSKTCFFRPANAVTLCVRWEVIGQ